MTYYELLDVAPNCDFPALRKAYYKKARECHPDLFAGSPEKTEEFKRLVEAFNILSDPERRYAYDQRIRAPVTAIRIHTETVMDTDSDDTLEELIVGNSPPEDATLMTLFRDLERTLVFITWREARNYFSERRFKASARLFQKLVALAPDNILYRVYLARSLTPLKEFGKAKYHYKAALAIGERRRPPQNLYTVRQELDALNKKKNPLLHRIISALSPKKDAQPMLTDEQMLRETTRTIQRMMDEQERRERKALGE